MARNDLQGTLDLLILKTLAQLGSVHGYGMTVHIQRISDDLLRIEEGSLYPALHRMERSGFIRSQWALSETNRRAKFYLLTPTGKKHLLVAERGWADVVKGVQAVLRFA